MKLYHIPGTSSLAFEAMIHIAKVTQDTIQLALFEENADRLAISPLGKVPALDTGQQALVEGAAINLWFAARHP